MSNPLECIKCDKCGKTTGIEYWYRVSYRNYEQWFCSRICLVEGMAPEVTKAIVVRQWVPTPEEEERMRQ